MSQAMQVNASEALASERKARTVMRINKLSAWLDAFGLVWITPILKMFAGEPWAEQLAELRRVLIVPLLGIAAFMMAWSALAPQVQTSLGAIPGPGQGWGQVINLYDDHVRERAKAEALHERQKVRNDKLIAAGKDDRVK